MRGLWAMGLVVVASCGGGVTPAADAGPDAATVADTGRIDVGTDAQRAGDAGADDASADDAGELDAARLDAALEAGALGDAELGDAALDDAALDDAPCVTDGDGDGFVALVCGGDDCDDTNGGVHPGAGEICDGIDDDCDGAIDGANAEAACIASAAPNTDAHCLSGACTSDCVAGWGDCDATTSGCETDLTTNAACGTCGNDCGAALSGPTACVGGACTCGGGTAMCVTTCYAPMAGRCCGPTDPACMCTTPTPGATTPSGTVYRMACFPGNGCAGGVPFVDPAPYHDCSVLGCTVMGGMVGPLIECLGP